MKRLFTILFIAAMFVSASFGQMVVKGDVVNKGAMKSSETVYVRANAKGATSGVNGRIYNKGTIKLGNGITYASNDTYDGILLNSYGESTPASVEFILQDPEHPEKKIYSNVKVVKEFEHGRYYAFSLPFDVNITDIEASNNYKVEDKFWFLRYDSNLRSQQGLKGDGKKDPNWAWMDEDPKSNQILKAGVGYMLYISNNTDPIVTITFPAASAATVNAIYPAGGHKILDSKFYRDNATLESDWGWHYIGVNRTANYILNNGLSVVAGHYVRLSDIGAGDVDEDNDGISNMYVYSSQDSWVSEEADNNIAISPYSAIFIQSGGSNPRSILTNSNTRFTFNYNGLTSNNADFHHNRVMRSDVPNRLRLALLDEKGNESDHLIVRQADNYHDNYALGEDAPKTFNNSTTQSEFYTLVENTPMAINRLRTLDNNIPVGLNMKQGGNFTISITDLEGFDGKDIYVLDNFTNQVHNLIDSDYTFTSATEVKNDRLALLFKKPTGILSPVSNIVAFADNNTAYVKNIKVGDQVSIYAISGQLISRGVASSTEQTYPLNGTGVYVVKVTGSENYVSKVINK